MKRLVLFTVCSAAGVLILAWRVPANAQDPTVCYINGHEYSYHSCECQGTCGSKNSGGHEGGGNDTNPAPPPNPCDEACQQRRREIENNSWRSTYTLIDPASLYRDNHENNNAGQPLPWDKVTATYAQIEAQGLMDRWKAYTNDPYHKDVELLKDWTSKLRLTIDIVYSWEDPLVAKQVVSELNNKCLEYVKQTLSDQILKLQPFVYDSPEVAAMKSRIIHEREDILSCGLPRCETTVEQYRDLDQVRVEQYRNLDQGHYDTAAPGIVEVETAHFRSPDDPIKGDLEFTANPTLDRLIKVAKGESWEKTCSETGDEVWCGEQ